MLAPDRAASRSCSLLRRHPAPHPSNFEGLRRVAEALGFELQARTRGAGRDAASGALYTATDAACRCAGRSSPSVGEYVEADTAQNQTHRYARAHRRRSCRMPAHRSRVISSRASVCPLHSVFLLQPVQI